MQRLEALAPGVTTTEFFPSMETMSDAVSRRPSTQLTKQVLNSAGSSAASTSPSVS